MTPATTTDGPQPPNCFRHNGETIEGLSARQYALLDYAWPRAGRSAEITDLAQAVWNIEAADLSRATVDQLVYRLNAWLSRWGIAWGVRVRNSSVQVYPRPGTKKSAISNVRLTSI